LLGVAPSVEHKKVIASLEIDQLIDVGANRGQFSLMTRMLHPSIPIHGFEPLSGEATIYRRIFKSDPTVVLHEMALGHQPGSATIHLSRRADSSSLLPIGEMQAKLFPKTEEVGTLTVRVACLDEMVDIWSNARRAVLKLDVQGFELSVLKGARAALKSCAYVYVECSEVQLYNGQALFPDVERFMNENGFRSILRANEQIVDGKLIQADHLFARN
jgi:FkbM family methyltransferase